MTQVELLQTIRDYIEQENTRVSEQELIMASSLILNRISAAIHWTRERDMSFLIIDGVQTKEEIK